jgi:hypothetical protein
MAKPSSLFVCIGAIDHRVRLEEIIRPQYEGSGWETAKFAALEGTNRLFGGGRGPARKADKPVKTAEEALYGR